MRVVLKMEGAVQVSSANMCASGDRIEKFTFDSACLALLEVLMSFSDLITSAHTITSQRSDVNRKKTSSASNKPQYSRETTLSSSHSDNGLPSGIFSSPGSSFILDERVQLTVGLQTQERHLILFSDMLIIAKSKSSSSLKLKKQVHLSEMWTGTCLTEVTEKKMSPENSFIIGWPTINYVVTFSSADIKERWLSALLWHIGEMKQNEYLKNLTLQIFVLDADNCSSTTTINVSNMETAESVMKKTLLQLGLPGRTSDHHLWVISGKDDPAYPLIGHEHPFSIALNSLRDSADQQQGTNNHTLLLDGREASFLEQLPKEKQCQFVLKPRLQAPMQLRRESLQKHTKRKKSLIDWALRRSTSAPTDSTPSQSPTTPQKLFGMSLSSVCPDGILPKPIMDMLLLLYHEGPSTRGIFRRSANAKTCKELKEKLNSGDDVQVDGESVFVAAAVITVAMLVQFLIENSAEIFGGDIAALFQRPDKNSRNAEKSLGIGIAQNGDSSDELEFSAYDLERPKHCLIPETDDIFEPPSGLLLDEEQEDWDLFSEITACYQSKTQKNASADSCDLVEEEGSFCSIGSIRSLIPARNRCSSEPSVCLSSQLPAQSHEPVARQSSCDATIMHSHTDYIHRLKQLQMESQKFIDEDLSTEVNNARQNLWQLPQTSSRVKQLNFQKSNMSSRAAAGSPLANTDWEKEERHLGFMGVPGPKLRSLDYASDLEQNPLCSPDGSASKEFLQINQEQHREKVVKHIEIRSVEACSPSQESLKRTKITFYMDPTKEYSWGSLVKEENSLTNSSSDSPSSHKEQSTSKGLQTVRVHIPQTVFYGQNTPLVLQSASRQHHYEPATLSSLAEHKESLQSASTPKELESKPVEVAQVPTQSRGFNTFSHTIRIILPASIQNTVREYFRQETKTCPMAEAEAVENELLRSRMEWLRSQPLAEMAAEDHDAVAFAEETFV
ncbi:UNVERIFIED_CONTAM: hypothetical protein H355_010956 [Colinus virginianus]|nr:hypothetical protein H355_010956 [Colinus virginianus]